MQSSLLPRLGEPRPALALAEVVARVLRFLPLGAVRVAAEVCSGWHCCCSRRLRACAPKSPQQYGHLTPGGPQLPRELRYYLVTPSLLEWALARFPAVGTLRCLLADGPAWHVLVAEREFRGLVAWALHTRSSHRPDAPLDYQGACGLAWSLTPVLHERRRLRGQARAAGAAFQYSKADHAYFKLVQKAKGITDGGPRAASSAEQKRAGSF